MAFTEVKQYFRPTNPGEVVALLAQYGSSARLLGGGTFLHGIAARGLGLRLDALIDLQGAHLAYVKAEQSGLVIGSATTLAALTDAAPVQQSTALAAIADALRYPPAQIRNMATVGGCLAAASPLFDLPVALMALDASVHVLGPRGGREISLHEFFVDYFESALRHDELLVEARIPKHPPGSASAFLKLETNANDLALLNVAVRLTVDQTGTCRDARVIAGGGVGKAPVRAVSCETVLAGKRITPGLVEEAAEKVTADVHPVSDHRASAKYRAALAKVFVRRTLARALDRLQARRD
ncbi:MAG TPA: FAD binding domain-containing protein [Terriglobales bacterium]|nr:FAD binding domain-containing protein [Terriglobales bacterium]